ncbi:MAG: hypothetical protein [Bacteriophage sp.]|nr:MAG: hypothetical protein [Bacteriophage sp.]
MTLLELLRQELPKRGGWPEGVRSIAQCHNGQIWYDNNKVNLRLEHVAKNARKLYHQFVDGESNVTREQYEAAPAAKNDGWIEWGGGEYPPVSTNTVVDVKLRCGSVTVRQPAGIMNWRSNASDEPGDIIAYRLHLMQEADLNECIGQDAAPVWNGEGLPPVSMEIEYKFAKANYRTDFSRGKVLAYGIHNVFMEHWASKNEFIQPLDKIEFRPIRTEAERAIDEMVRLSSVSIGAAKILYDAGYRKG